MRNSFFDINRSNFLRIISFLDFEMTKVNEGEHFLNDKSFD